MSENELTEDIEVLRFNLNGIKACQQNRHPLLFVDQILRAVPGKSAHGIKCFSYNEWFFPAHFEDEPNVPGFIQLECLVQVFIMTFLCMEEHRGRKTNFVSINNVKFKRMIVPGEMLEVKAKLDSLRRGIARGRAEGHVNGELACSGEFVVAIPDVLSAFKPQ
jgi:3-hydroxyacyl-[acyl-carrier-protein] dehydratase